MSWILLLIANILVKVTVEPAVSTEPTYTLKNLYKLRKLIQILNPKHSNIIAANSFFYYLSLTFNFPTEAQRVLVIDQSSHGM